MSNITLFTAKAPAFVANADLSETTLALAGGSMGTAIDLGAGIQIPLSDRLGLFIEPSYQMALSPAVKHPSFDLLPFNPRIHSFSIATGLSFQFH